MVLLQQDYRQQELYLVEVQGPPPTINWQLKNMMEQIGQQVEA